MRQLEDVIVKGIALTGKPANRRPFLLKKSQEPAVSDSSEPSIQAAPSEILDAVRAVALAKGEDADTSDALEAVAHLVYGNPNLTLQDLMAVAKAAQVQDVAKASKKKDEPDAEAEEEGYDEESEQDPSDDEDDGDDEDEEDGEAEDKKGKKMPAFLKEKLKKGGPGSGPQPGGGSGSADKKGDPSDAFGKRGSGSESSPGLKGAPQTASEVGLQRASQGANKASGAARDKDTHEAAQSAHEKAAKQYFAAAGRKGTSDGAKRTYNEAAQKHAEKALGHAAASKSASMKKSHQSADTSANQGGPMEAETAEEIAISKSQYDSIREELAKSEARIAAFEHKEALAIEKSANVAKYSDLTLDHDKLAKSMLALRKSAPEQVEALEQSLSAANEQVRVSKASGASIFARKSSDGFAAPATASADKFRAMVEEHVAKSGGSRTQAIAAIAKTKDGLAAYKEMNGAN